MCWISIHEHAIEGLLHYVDDAFSVSFSEDLSHYEPYGCLMPADQSHFLHLLDQLRVPHEDKKQVHGVSLEIIDLVVSV